MPGQRFVLNYELITGISVFITSDADADVNYWNEDEHRITNLIIGWRRKVNDPAASYTHWSHFFPMTTSNVSTPAESGMDGKWWSQASENSSYIFCIFETSLVQINSCESFIQIVHNFT